MRNVIKDCLQHGKKNLIIIYILCLCGVATSLVAPVMAIALYCYTQYFNRNYTNMFKGHYLFIMRTFVIWAILCVISLIFGAVLIGQIVHSFLDCWLALRGVGGLVYITRNTEHPNPGTFWVN